MFQERTRLSDPSPGVKQQIPFVRDMDSKPEVIIGFQEIKYLPAEMMNVNHYFGKTGHFQFQNHMLQHRTPGYGHKRLRHRIGQRFQPAAHAGREYHCFHCSSILFYTVASNVCSMFCSRCTSSTLTPNFRFKCSAKCCAE